MRLPVCITPDELDRVLGKARGPASEVIAVVTVETVPKMRRRSNPFFASGECRLRKLCRVSAAFAKNVQAIITEQASGQCRQYLSTRIVRQLSASYFDNTTGETVSTATVAPWLSPRTDRSQLRSYHLASIVSIRLAGVTYSISQV